MWAQLSFKDVFHDFWPSFSILNYFWCWFKDTRSIQNFSLKAWKYKWLTAKNSKSKAIIWCKWKINKDIWSCNFYLNCAKGNNSKKCFRLFFLKVLHIKIHCAKAIKRMKLKFSVFIHLKIADLEAKIFNALQRVYYFVLTFETKKMPKKRTIFPLKIQLCPQISTKIAINLQTMSCSPIKASVQISASYIE